MRETSSDNSGTNNIVMNTGVSRDMISSYVITDPMEKAVIEMVNEALR